jgi:nucleotidyltransferase AbiEii toxin of type IV toxin-antitoxin system
VTIPAEEFDPVRILRVLNERQVRYVLVGGMAAAMRGSPVITGDVDVCYAPDRDNLERLASALRDLHARLRGVEEGVSFLLDARTLQAGDAFTFVTSEGPLDVLGEPSGSGGFEQLDQSASDMDVAGLTIRVASLDDLIAMKRASRRPKDLVDLEWLGAVRDELDRAEDADDEPRDGS